MMQEKELIEICKRLVEQKFQLLESESWKQRDFEYLSDLIFEKTNVRLSISTLKRIWKDYDNITPQTHTLNTLVNLIGYSRWSDFKLSRSPETYAMQNPTEEDRQNVSKVSKRWIYLSGIIIIILLSLGYLSISHFKSNKIYYEQGHVLFKSKKSISSGVPNTVVFEYDISKLDFDSAFIQHSWDKRMRAKINKDNHFQTFIYYYPGYHTAKLIVNDQIVKHEKVNITTTGWEAIVDDETSGPVPHYIPKKDIIDKNKLYVSRETLIKNDIEIRDKKFYVDYFNVLDVKETRASNFTFETKIKNSLEEGAFVCQYSQVTLLCENGRISIPFCNRGCEANIHLHISEVFRAGKENDMTAFGVDLSDWKNIIVKAVNKKIIIYVDGNPIYNVKFNDDLGKITGFHYRFYGCGSVKFVKLYDDRNELTYNDDFSE